MTTEAVSDFVIGPDTAGLRWFVVAICAGFTAVGVVLIIFTGLLGIVVGAVAVAFFAVLGLPIMLPWAIHPRPRLLISPTGIWINRYAVNEVGVVGWEDVATVQVGSRGSFSYVSISVRDPAQFLRRQPLARRALLRLNGWSKKPDPHVISAPLPVPVSDLKAAITARRGTPPDSEFFRGA